MVKGVGLAVGLAVIVSGDGDRPAGNRERAFHQCNVVIGGDVGAVVHDHHVADVNVVVADLCVGSSAIAGKHQGQCVA